MATDTTSIDTVTTHERLAAVQTADMFTIEHLTDALEARGLKFDVQTIFYALHQATLSHPDYDDGKPFTIDAYKNILGYLGGYCGGGKMMFKIAATLDSRKFGRKPNARLATAMRKAGFVFEKKADTV